MTWVIYRWYDADDVVLYGGITNNLERRLRQHRAKSWWVQWAVDVEQVGDEYPDRQSAARAERRYHGVFNVQSTSHTPRLNIEAYLRSIGEDPDYWAEYLPIPDYPKWSSKCLQGQDRRAEATARPTTGG